LQSQRRRFQRYRRGASVLVRHSGERRADTVAEADGDSVSEDATILEAGGKPDFP